MNARDIILAPVITEKSVEAMSGKKFTFRVADGANKIEIANAIEKIFEVKVASVNTINVPGKKKRMGVHVGMTSKRKKAIVVLTKDSKSIDLFENMV